VFFQQPIFNTLSSERAEYINTGQSPVKKIDKEILKPRLGVAG